MTRKSKKAPAQSRKKIFLVEDHPIFRQGLVQILNSEKNLFLCGTAGNVDEALSAIARTKPDLVLVDISLPGRSGLELIKEIRLTNRTVKLLVLSMHDEAIYAARVLRAGGDGYIMKQEDPDEIVDAIRDVLEGHIYVSEEVMESTQNGDSHKHTGQKARPMDQLADSDLEVLELIGRGNSTREIARKLRQSERTVTALRSKIRKKLKLKNARALLRYAVCWVENIGN